MADFKEDDHPRDDKGRFSAGALSVAAKQWAEKSKPANKPTGFYATGGEKRREDYFTKSFAKVGELKNKPVAELRKMYDGLYATRKSIEEDVRERAGISSVYMKDTTKPAWIEQDKWDRAQPIFKEAREQIEKLDAEREKVADEWQRRGKTMEGVVAKRPKQIEEDYSDKIRGERPGSVTKKEWEEGKLKGARAKELDNKLTGEKGKGPKSAAELAAAEKKRKEGVEKRKETSAVNKALGQKDAPVDLLDLAAMQLEPKTAGGVRQSRWNKENQRRGDFSQQARSLVNQAIGKYVAGDAPAFESGWYGRYDPKTGREVEHVSEYDLNKPILPEDHKYGAGSYTRSGDRNPHLRLKGKSGEDVEASEGIYASGGPGAYNAYKGGPDTTPKQSTREAAEAKGYKVVGPKEPGWYFKDTLGNDEPERVSGSDDRLRFPVAVHPAVANKQFPGTKKTYAQVAFEAANKYTSWENTGGHGYGGADKNGGRSEYNGIGDFGTNQYRDREATELDKVSLKLWKRLEPQIRADMAKDGGYNRFWTDNHIQEGAGGGKYGGIVMGLGGGITESKFDPKTGKSEDETKPLAERLRKWAGSPDGRKTRETHLGTRPWNEEAWAGKVDPFTEDPMTRADAEGRGVLKKYIEGVRAKRKAQ